MHVLVCEDDELIASGIVAGLTAQGLTVEHVATASAARAMLKVLVAGCPQVERTVDLSA